MHTLRGRRHREHSSLFVGGSSGSEGSSSNVSKADAIIIIESAPRNIFSSDVTFRIEPRLLLYCTTLMQR